MSSELDNVPQSGWIRYQAIYFRYFNSGCPVAVFAILLQVFVLEALGFITRVERFYGNGLNVFLLIPALLASFFVVPGLLTHCIPGLIMYFWVWGFGFWFVHRMRNILGVSGPWGIGSGARKKRRNSNWRGSKKTEGLELAMRPFSSCWTS